MYDISIHNDGFVRLDTYNADDLSVVNAARVSFSKRSNILSESDEKLIGFLMREKHGTPLEHNFFRFHIKCPIFVAREWFRHRIGNSYNEMSMRYHTPDELEFYVPNPDDFRTQIGKPGAYSFQPISNGGGECEYFQNIMMQVYEHAKETYEILIAKGVAKEQARCVLPVSQFTEFYWSVNARSLMNFLSLRNDQHAQKEIRDYAEAIEDMFSQIMPITYRAFSLNRVAV